MTNKYELELGGRVFEFEFGKIANLADGAVTIKVDDTVLLVTACARDEAMDVDFLPLTVEVQEKSYAAGKMPGGFFKREGRPSEQAILNCRLVDRPLRPLFPKNYHNDTQIAITVLSTDLEFPYSSLGILGASMALMVSNIPFNEPVGACEIGYVDGELVVNPTYEQLESSDLQLTVAGTSEAIMMVEAGANFVSEELLLEALKTSFIERGIFCTFFIIWSISSALLLEWTIKSKFVPHAMKLLLTSVEKQIFGNKNKIIIRLFFKNWKLNSCNLPQFPFSF